MSGAKRIVLAGNVLVDVVKRIERWPEQDHLVSILSPRRNSGGAVCTRGVFLKTHDPSLEVCACGMVGKDDYGDWLADFLAWRGLDISRISRTDSAPTSYTDVMTVADTGSRTFFHARGANARFSAEHVDLASLDCRLFHLGYLLLLDALDAPHPECGTMAAALLRDVQSRGIETSIDIVSENSPRFQRVVRPALKYCDHLVVNEFEGEMASGMPCHDGSRNLTPDSLRRVAEALLALGVRKSVTIHCPQMGITLEAGGTFAARPSLKLPPGWIKGAVGAGDAFCAGRLYAIINGMPPEEGLVLASAMAAANLSQPDSVSGALPLAETLALTSRFSPS